MEMTMVLKTNEGTVCDAVVRYLEDREKCERTEVWCPEETKDHEVELAWSLGGKQYVMEHTSIEPFEDFMRMNAQAEKHFEPIKRACEGLTLNVLEMQVPARCMQDLGSGLID